MDVWGYCWVGEVVWWWLEERRGFGGGGEEVDAAAGKVNMEEWECGKRGIGKAISSHINLLCGYDGDVIEATAQREQSL